MAFKVQVGPPQIAIQAGDQREDAPIAAVSEEMQGGARARF
jgi:hypothetical protein